MKNILVINRKGGCGKTLISDEIAFAFDRMNIPYNFYDLDWCMLSFKKPFSIER